MRSVFSFLAAVTLTGSAFSLPAEWALPTQSPQDRQLRAYFERRVAALESASRLESPSPESWPATRDSLRLQLKEMLGLEPEPPRGDLRVRPAGTLEAESIVVEKFHFQPVPELYLAANLYRPKEPTGRLPAILYVCGHAQEIKDGVSFGNKAHYHPHGVWFAKHGYVCLIIDTVQWGELVGDHHGTYRLGRWWWPSRGFTPAGVEAWNAIRAIDYLVSRDDVDPGRIGVTGRSGGGAYSWWAAALDDRVAVAAPTAGITTLRNHVLDGCVEGHCDCMYFQNTYGWDYDRVAALVAPRPLLIVNTDKDDIFPLDGVYSIYRNTRRIYESLGALKNVGLHVAEGPHQDPQALNTGAFAWFERFLKNAKLMDTFDDAARSDIARENLRVFSTLPSDERTTRIDRDFVAPAPAPGLPGSAAEWKSQRDAWMTALQAKVFRGWSSAADPPRLRRLDSVSEDPADLERYAFSSEADVDLQIHVTKPPAAGAAMTLELVGDSPAKNLSAAPGMARFAPRGTGREAWSGDARKFNQIRRRFLLCGQTLEGQQVWDIRRAVQSLASIPNPPGPIVVRARGAMAALALYAALFEPAIAGLELADLPESHSDGPCLLNVLRVLDLPQVMAMVAERIPITVLGARGDAWSFATGSAAKLGWPHPPVLKPSLSLIDVRRVWNRAGHCAFTDLLLYGDRWFCVFREGDAHVPGANGVIRVLTSRDGNEWESAAVLAEAGVDLRDPKISAASDGRLVLLIGGSIYDGNDGAPDRRFVSARTRVCFSLDGREWSAPQPVGITDDWLWRLTWHRGEGYGIAYPLDPRRSPGPHLWKSTDGLRYDRLSALGLPAIDEPNEAAIQFDDDTMIALVRREKGNRHAYLGRSRPPFAEWAWQDTGHIIQGPEMLHTRGRTIYAGRDYVGNRREARTVAGDLVNGQARPQIVLPSGGDCSYPGLVEAPGGNVWMSYYSSHEGTAAIYLARLSLNSVP